MIIDPVSAVVGGVSAIGGIFQSIAADKAKKQDYLNQKAYSDATATFNRWQATQNAKASDLNAQYSYWAQTLEYNQGLAYTNQMRNYDLSQEIAQAQKVGETRAGAGADYVTNAQALSEKFREEGMARAVGMQQYQYRVLQQSAAFQAAMGEGASSDRIVNNFARQAGDYQTLQAINEGLSKRQYNRDQLSRITNYLSQYNSQAFYEAQDRMDPIAPFAPLPTLVSPPPPSMSGGAPGNAGLGLGIGTAMLGGFNSMVSTATAIKNLG